MVLSWYTSVMILGRPGRPIVRMSVLVVAFFRVLRARMLQVSAQLRLVNHKCWQFWRLKAAAVCAAFTASGRRFHMSTTLKAEKAWPIVVIASLGHQIIGAGSYSGCPPVGGQLKPLFTELLITIT
jgi:hypothetical protein